MMRTVTLAVLVSTLAACGDEHGDYEIRGVAVYTNDEGWPTREELQPILRHWFEHYGEHRGKRLRRMQGIFESLQWVSFAMVQSQREPGLWGTYDPDLQAIRVRGDDGVEAAVFVLYHELVHHYLLHLERNADGGHRRGTEWDEVTHAWHAWREQDAGADAGARKAGLPTSLFEWGLDHVDVVWPAGRGN